MRPVLLSAVLGACCLASLAGGAGAESAATFPADSPVVFPGEISRKGDGGRGAHGPWKSAVAFAALPRRGVKVGETVTVIPMRAGLAPVDLKITSVEAQEATDLAQAAWLVEADTTLEEFLTAKPDPGRSDDHPLEAIVVYPARSHAHLVPARAAEKDLPKEPGCSPRTLFGAVDLDDDARADAAIFRFCCERPKTTWKSSGPTPCNSNCESIYLRSAGGPWKVVYEAGES
jgi:hypothetical protein